VKMYLSPKCINALKYTAFWRNGDDPSLKKFLDFRRCMGDLKNPEMEHSRYNLELNTITSYYDETTEIGKKALNWKEEFKASYFTPCELLACKAKVACLSVDDKKSNSVKLFWNLEDIIMESEIVDEESRLQWKEGMKEFEGTETVSTTSTKKTKTFNVSFDEYIDSNETNRNEIDDDPSETNRNETDDDFEIVDAIDWEFDTPIPSWLQKAMKQHKSLTSQTDSSKRPKLAKEPIWWRIIDASDPKILQDFLSETEFLELSTKISSALNIGNSMNSNELRKIGELVKPKGIYGAIVELMKMEMKAEESNSEPDLFDDDQSCDKASTITTIEENDYLDKDVSYILELIRFTCEMLEKEIPQRKNSERDIDMFVKRHIFSCFEDVLDCHFGDMVSRASRDRRCEAVDAPDNAEGFHLDWMFTKHELGKDTPWGREFSMCESKVDDDMKDTLKTQKTLRDMHKGLVKVITAESSGSLSKQVLRACTKLHMPGFVSKSFFIRAILIVYVGGNFYLSFELAKLNIPTKYNELGETIKIARVMLQIKKLLRSTVSRFKRIKERAEKEKFASGKVVMSNGCKEYRTPEKSKK
ncbi:13649_t:CDS:10, partial [Funneliformis geosporum]